MGACSRFIGVGRSNASAARTVRTFLAAVRLREHVDPNSSFLITA